MITIKMYKDLEEINRMLVNRDLDNFDFLGDLMEGMYSAADNMREFRKTMDHADVKKRRKVLGESLADVYAIMYFAVSRYSFHWEEEFNQCVMTKAKDLLDQYKGEETATSEDYDDLDF